MDIKLRFYLSVTAIMVLFAGIQMGMTDTYIVINTNDSGAGSLRQAMLDANAHAGEDTIIFQIPVVDPNYDGVVGVWTIQPQSSLPGFIDDGTLIDGTTQADFIGSDTNLQGPEIAVDGINAQNSAGFGLDGSNNELKALAIYRFDYEPVWINGDYNKVKGCYIGPDPTGTLRFLNQSGGIYIDGGSYNEIGGPGEGEGNTISGNKWNGIYINRSAHENHIINNYIGINSAGDDTLGNGSTGIQIAGGSKRNTIGPGNVISGNYTSGIKFISEETDSNSVIGNLIGTDPSGYLDWGNGSDGISISNGPDHTLVGGSLPEDRNIISGNHYWGIKINGEKSDSNRVIGNYIGTDITGTASISNGSSGIYICSGSKYNVIGGEIEGEGNLLSGNEYGIVISNAGTEENRVIGNLIGTDASGAQPLPNIYSGVGVRYEAKYNIIGPGNTIAYHAEYGVYVFNIGTIGNTITENIIHSNGMKGIKNSWGGNNELPPPVITELGSVSGTAPPGAIVEIFSGPDIQGKDFEASVLADGTGNFLWEGTPSGFWVTATATDSEGSTSEFSMGKHLGALEVTTTANAGEGSLRWAIESVNNTLGPDTIVFNIPTGDIGFDGTVWTIQLESFLPDISDDGTVIDGFSQAISQEETNEDGPEVMVDGSLLTDWGSGLRLTSSENEIKGLIVSGFVNHGIEISGLEARNNTIRGNYIGTDPSADDTLGNGWGVLIWNWASNNTIGGITALDRNVISGNYYGGINLDADSNTVLGNYIGTNRTGESRLSNIGCGINISYHRDNRIGGASPEERNVISGNSGTGIDCYGEGAMYNVISGNYIGINAAGTDTLSNKQGIYILGGPTHNTVGGDGPGEGNIIISAKYVCLGISNADSNEVFGNAFGTDLAGLQHWGGSNHGIFISNGAEGNLIGGSLSGQRNIISNHGRSGIVLYNDDTRNNTIQGNCIGTDSSGITKMGNGSYGIEISNGASSNVIGGLLEGEGNIICDNGYSGILIAGSETDSNVVLGNCIGTDPAKTLDMGNSGNGIELYSDTQYNQIGPGNTIYYSGYQGVSLYGALTNYNRITQNSISNNAGKGIYLGNGANDSINAPVITGQSPFVGTAPANSSVEIFSDSTDQGKFYETTVTADGAGNWTWSGTPAGPQVTATATDAAGNTSEFSIALVVSVERDKELVLPMSWHLSQNYPNPFNPVTTIEIGVREPCNVKLQIYNLLGREVVNLVDEFYQQGLYHVTFDASGLSSGIYFYRVEMGGFQAVKKMVLLE